MANVPSSPILATLMMEALSSSETSVLTRTTWNTHPRRWHSAPIFNFRQEVLKKLNMILLPFIKCHWTHNFWEEMQLNLNEL
jgi:hypothetical protein